MLYNVTDIKFDFNDDLDPIYSVSKSDQELITQFLIRFGYTVNWIDLIEEITCNSGWCISSIDYEIQLK